MSQSESNGYYIELFGLPGSGKTTVATALAHHDHTIIESVLYPRKSQSIVFVIMHPILASRLFSILFHETYRTGTWSLLRLKLSLLLNTFGRIAGIDPEEKTVLDEGILQRLLSLFETEKSRDYFSSLLTHIPLPKKCIVLKAQPSSFRRYANAEHPRAQLGERYIKEWEPVLRKNFSTLLEVVRTTDVEVFELSSPQEISSRYNEIVHEH